MKIYKTKARRSYLKEGIQVGQIYYYCEPDRRKNLGLPRRIKRATELELIGWIKDYIQSFQGELATNMRMWRCMEEHLQTEDDRELLCTEINDYIDEKYDRLNNVPESLQSTHVLNEQIQELEDYLNRIEDLDIE